MSLSTPCVQLLCVKYLLILTLLNTFDSIYIFILYTFLFYIHFYSRYIFLFYIHFDSIHIDFGLIKEEHISSRSQISRSKFIQKFIFTQIDSICINVIL